MVKQFWVNWKFFLRRMYLDIFRFSFLLYFLAVFVLLLTSFRDMFVLYPVLYLVCFGVSFVKCLRKRDMPDEFLEGDQ